MHSFDKPDVWDGTHYRHDKLHLTGKIVVPPGSHKSDGGSTNYYAIPPGTRDLDDLIDGLGMSFRIANIFKACMRFGKKDGTSQLYDLNKIIFFATRERDKLLGEVVHIDLPLNRSVT